MQPENYPLYDIIKQIYTVDRPYAPPFTVNDYWAYLIFTVLMVITALVIIAILFWGIVLAFDTILATKKIHLGTLIDKQYVGASVSTTTSISVPISSIPMKTTSRRSLAEEYLFFVRTDEKVYKVEVQLQQYFAFDIEQRINIEVTTGGIFKEDLRAKLNM